MPLVQARAWTVLAAAVVFAAFLLRLFTLDDTAPGRTLIIVALVASGLVLAFLLESLLISRVALRRARRPDRLMAAVSRGRARTRSSGAPLRDATRLVLLRKQSLESAAFVDALPRTLGSRPGPRASWLAPLMNDRANQIVLARTDSELLVCQPDVDRTVGVVATVPTDQICFIETGQIRWLGSRRLLIGIGFEDGSSIATAHSLEFGPVLTRFFGPLLDTPNQ